MTPRSPQERPQVPRRAGEVLVVEAPALLQHSDSVALLGPAQCTYARPESRADDQPVEIRAARRIFTPGSRHRQKAPVQPAGHSTAGHLARRAGPPPARAQATRRPRGRDDLRSSDPLIWGGQPHAADTEPGACARLAMPSACRPRIGRGTLPVTGAGASRARRTAPRSARRRASDGTPPGPPRRT